MSRLISASANRVSTVSTVSGIMGEIICRLIGGATSTIINPLRGWCVTTMSEEFEDDDYCCPECGVEYDYQECEYGCGHLVCPKCGGVR